MSFKITISKNGQTKQYEEFNLKDALKHLDDGEVTSWIKGKDIEVRVKKY